MNESHVVITTMNKAGWEEYGRRFISTFLEFWPPNVTVEIVAEGFSVAEDNPRVKVLDFSATCGRKMQEVERVCMPTLKRVGINSTSSYRFQVIKFAKKGIVITDALTRHAGRRIIWLDSDIYAFEQISTRALEELTRVRHDDVFCTYLRRFGLHTESGFLSFNAAHPLTQDFVNQYESLYLSGGASTWRHGRIAMCLTA